MDAPPDPRSQIPDPRYHTPQIPQPLPTSTVSAHSPILIHFSPWTHHQIPHIPELRSHTPQIPQPLPTSTVSAHSSIVIHFSPWTHHQIPDISTPPSTVPDISETMYLSHKMLYLYLHYRWIRSQVRTCSTEVQENDSPQSLSPHRAISLRGYCLR
jgi:hypothetical protein